VTIPSSVTSIGSWAFYGCRNLSEMEFLGAPPTFSSLSYPTPITFRVHSGMGWEDWSVPSRVTLEILQDVHTQTIELTAGWNWVAFNVLPDSRKAADALGSEGFTANDIIQTSGGMARFSGSAWGDLTLEFGRLYQIYVANDVTVEVSGDACETSAVLLTVGWNWIGNVTTETILPSLLTHSGGWTAGDRIQTPGKNVIYTGEKWIPDGAVTLEPSKGCQIHTAKGGWLAFPALYAVVDLSGGPDAESYPVRYSLNGPNLSSDKCRTTELWLRKIPAGTFIMGSPEDEVGRSTNETQHQVVLTQDYYIGIFECTQRQWNLVMGSNPSSQIGDCRPVENVSCNMIRGSSDTAGAGWPAYGHAVDATSFMGKLQAKTGLTFDLPTNAQWEYACRAGTTTALNSGKNLISTSSDANMDEVGRYKSNQADGKGGYTSYHTKVGSYLPNAWGLYDMHGNVWEFCLDWYSEDSYTTAAVDPVGPSTGTARVACGGCHFNTALACRSARHAGGLTPSGYNNGNGFRVALHPKQDLYVVVDLSSGPDATSYPVRYTNSMPNLDDDTCRTTELWLRKIPAGTFIMGSPEDEVGRNFREIQHQVTLTQDYYIGVFECTQKQWNLVMGNSPSSYTGDCRPVENVSYNMIRGTSATAGAGWPTYGHAVDATSFMGKLQAKTGLTFDLPTEAQWEYACRAGTTTALNSGRNLVSSGHNAAMDEVGRYQDNQSDGKGGYSEHTTVGNYLPNAWGLYDMHGNVWEWCLDWYSNYGTDTVVNPIGPNTGSYRLFRGGSWFTNGASNCRSAYRYNGGYDASFHDHNRGFRIACLP
jgi:formylglycine-generating enzyme required for sulfatase activity